MQITSGLGVLPQASFWPTDRGCTPCTARSLGTVSAADLGELAFLLAAAGARPVVAVAIATLAGATPRPAGGAHRWFGCVVGEYPGSHPCAPPVPQAELGGAPSRFGLLWRPKDVLLVIRPSSAIVVPKLWNPPHPTPQHLVSAWVCPTPTGRSAMYRRVVAGSWIRRCPCQKHYAFAQFQLSADQRLVSQSYTSVDPG